MASKAAPMNKAELISAISKQMAVSKKEAGGFIQALNDIACSEIKKKNCFVIPGLARISKVHRRARTGRNPSSGEKIKIKARTALKFKPAKALQDATMGPRGRGQVIEQVKLSKPEREVLDIEDSVVWLEGWFESKEDFPWKVLKSYQDPPPEKIVVVYKKKDHPETENTEAQKPAAGKCSDARRARS